MYTEEQKKQAVLLFIQYDLSPSAVIYELGYPSGNTIRSWYRQYQKTGGFEQRSRNGGADKILDLITQSILAFVDTEIYFLQEGNH